MTGYSEGKHDESVDTKDRLVRVGAKYQSTVPAVADGDNAHILVDAAGRPRIEDYMVGQARLGNAKNTRAQISKTTAAQEDIAAWTVTNGKTGYLAHVKVSVLSHASETLHLVLVQIDTTTVASVRLGQGDSQYDFFFPIPPKLAGDGSKKIHVSAEQATTNPSTYNANMNGWEE